MGAKKRAFPLALSFCMLFRVLALLLACLISSANLGAPVRLNSLEIFLCSPDLAKRKTAYLNVLKNREKYTDQIQRGLETFEKTKDKRFEILRRYIYLAAIIRSDKFIDPLVMVYKDYENLGGECIYCCPITFVLSLYAAFAGWSPPPDILTRTTDMILTDLRTSAQGLMAMKSKPLVKERYPVEFADPEKQKWFEGLEQLSVEELIKKTGPENPDHNERYWGAQALSDKVTDDKNLTDLYWLAIEELTNDPSPFYRCCVYEAIERAEIAKAARGGAHEAHHVTGEGVSLADLGANRQPMAEILGGYFGIGIEIRQARRRGRAGRCGGGAGSPWRGIR